ncbi:MAG TPA: hypothetical protein VFI78_07350 [Salinimicrobium sp.]|nr:hypothetical protein [Salinimicrobium sp.]
MSAKNKYIWALLMGLFSSHFMGQVGINTTDPKAQLDIAISDMDSPKITDGILIPRINNFPASDPTAAQHGMLVFLNSAKVGFPIGFYYWSQDSKSWKPISENAFSNFYKEGTQAPSKDINDAIFRNGNVRIGGNENTNENKVKLSVTIKPKETAVKTGLEILNENSATNRNTYSITATNSSATNDIKYGIKNTVSAAGEGTHYGIWNDVSQNNSTYSEIYGIYNSVGRTYGATKKHYGIYSEIGTDEGDGWVYGIYSKAFGNDPDEVYAGFFEGRVGIGNPEKGKHYILPSAIGLKNQVLMTNDAGIVSWKYSNYKNYTSTSSAPANYIIPDGVFTLRIYDHVKNITIPDSSENLGRVLLLINWFGNPQTTFSFLGGDSIYDPTTDLEIKVINGGQRLKIQSIGYNKWIVIGN